MSGLSTLLDSAESDSRDDVGANRLLVLKLVALVGGVVGGKTTRVTLKRELVKKVGELPVDKLPTDSGDRPLPLPLPVLPASVTLDTWKRLRDGLANGLTIGDGNGDLSRFLSQLRRFVLEFLTLTVGGDITMDVSGVTMGGSGSSGGGGSGGGGGDNEQDDNKSSIGDVMPVVVVVAVVVFGDGDLMVVVLSKFDVLLSSVVSLKLVGDVRIMF